MKINYSNHQTDNNNYTYYNNGLQPTVIYLNNAVDVKAHDELWDITHQIVEPVVNTCQNVDWFIVIPEKHREEVGGQKLD